MRRSCCAWVSSLAGAQVDLMPRLVHHLHQSWLVAVVVQATTRSGSHTHQAHSSGGQVAPS